MKVYFVGDELPEALMPLVEDSTPLPEHLRAGVGQALTEWPGVADYATCGQTTVDGETGISLWFAREDRRTAKPIYTCFMVPTPLTLSDARAHYVKAVAYALNEYQNYVTGYLKWGAPELREQAPA